MEKDVVFIVEEKYQKIKKDIKKKYDYFTLNEMKKAGILSTRFDIV